MAVKRKLKKARDAHRSKANDEGRALFEAKELSISVGKKVILDKVNLKIREGDCCALFGPNGSGKTTLLMTIAGVPGYTIEHGSMFLDGKDLRGLDAHERANLGVFTAFQQPPEVVGVKLRDILKICLKRKPKEDLTDKELRVIERLNLTEFLDRDINLAFSGGEKKRAEVLQMIFSKSRFILLDEPDSGVDMESLELIGNEIQAYLDADKKRAALLITHQGRILDYVHTKCGCVMLNGSIGCYGGAKMILKDIQEKGYEGCVKCRQKRIMTIRQ